MQYSLTDLRIQMELNNQGFMKITIIIVIIVKQNNSSNAQLLYLLYNLLYCNYDFIASVVLLVES